VFVTKYRRPVFTNTMLTAGEQLMREGCTSVGAELREFNRETDYWCTSRLARLVRAG
jgi:putative transposase